MQRILKAVVTLCLTVGFSIPSYAIFGIGDIVLDPTNLVQNTASAIAAVKNEVNTAAAYIKQIEATISLARSLQSVNGLTNLAGVQQELVLYNQLQNTSMQLANVMEQSLRLSQNVQAQYGASNSTWHDFLTSRSAANNARTQALASQYATIDQSMLEIAQRRQAIVSQLQDAPGQTAAMQAVGASIDTLVGQNQQMVALLKAQGQAALAKQSVDDASAAAAQKALTERQQQLTDSANRYY